MAPDFDKIQAGMSNGLSKTRKIKKDNSAEISASEVSDNNVSFKQIDMGTGVAGRSSVRMDNFDTDMARFDKNYRFAELTNKYIEALVRKGYSLEDATMAVYRELGI